MFFRLPSLQFDLPPQLKQQSLLSGLSCPSARPYGYSSALSLLLLFRTPTIPPPPDPTISLPSRLLCQSFRYM